MNSRFAFLFCLVSTLRLAGCGMTVTPPAMAEPGVAVFIADHGIHTSLIIPRDDDRLAQFSYSRFDWAALDQDQWYRSIPALLIPGAGTLGTRDFPGPATRENLTHQFELANSHPPVQSIELIHVTREARDRVLSELDARWRASESTAVFNQRRGIVFVKDATSYSLFHNCNHEVASWLRGLGCRVSGAAMTAEVTVRRPADAVQERSPGRASPAAAHTDP